MSGSVLPTRRGRRVGALQQLLWIAALVAIVSALVIAVDNINNYTVSQACHLVPDAACR